MCRAKEELRTTPIYPHSAAYAREHGELEQYRASNNVNLQCKESIEAAVREHFDGMYLSHDAAKGVIETYGMERVSMVLSNTIHKPPLLFLLFLFGGTMTINDVKKQCKN